MIDILAITAPIYLVVLTGFLMTRFGPFGKVEMRTFGKFVVNLALPALLFKALSERQFAEIINVSYLLAYAVGSLLVMGTGYFWSRRIARLSPLTSTFYAMGMTCSNSGFVGYPILLLALPSVAGVALALNMIVENLLVIPVLLIMAERGGGGSAWATLRKLMRRLAANPLILGMLAGLAVSLLELRLPKVIVQTVGMFAAASGALSLFVIGGTLVGLPVGGMGRQVAPIVVGKLIVHPLCVLLAIMLVSALGLAPIDPTLRTAALLMAALPMMGIYATLAQQYGQEDFCAVAQLLTTLTSFLTLSSLLWLFRISPISG